MRIPFLLATVLSALCHCASAHPGRASASPSLHGFIVYVHTKADGYDTLMLKVAPGAPSRTLIEHLPHSRRGIHINAPNVDATGRYVTFTDGSDAAGGLRVWVVRIRDGFLTKITPDRGGVIENYIWSPSGSRLGIGVKRAGSSRICVWAPGQIRATEIPHTNGATLWDWSAGDVALLDETPHNNVLSVRSSTDGKLLAKWRAGCVASSLTSSSDGKWFAYESGVDLLVGRLGRAARRIARDVGPGLTPLWAASGPALLIQYEPKGSGGDMAMPGPNTPYVGEWKPSLPALRDIRHWEETADDCYARLLLAVSHDAKWLIFRDESGKPGKVMTEVIAINRSTKSRITLLRMPSRQDWSVLPPFDASIAWHETSR